MPNDITFGFEKLADVVKEPGFRELYLTNYDEIGERDELLPLNVSWPMLLKAEAAGSLLLYVARAGKQLIGYQAFYLAVDPATSTLGAWDLPYYLDPEYREGMRGQKLLFGAEPELRRRGVRRIRRHFKIRAHAGRGALIKLFRRAGYRPFEVIVTKVLT